MALENTQILNITLGLSKQTDLSFPFQFFQTSGYEKEEGFFSSATYKEKYGKEKRLVVYSDLENINSILIEDGKIIFDDSKERFGQAALGPAFQKLVKIRDELIPKEAREQVGKLYTTLIVEYSRKGEDKSFFIILQRDNGWTVFDEDKSPKKDGEGIFSIENKSPAQRKAEKEKKSSEQGAEEESKEGALGKAIGIIGEIAKFIGAPPEKVEAAKAWIKENPEMAGALSSVVLPRVLDFVRGKDVDMSLTGLGLDAFRGAALSAALNYFMGDKAPKIGGSSSGGGDEGGALGRLRAALVGSQDDFIVYDRGASRDSETAELQRCLIRFGGGNLEAERKNLPSAYYGLNTNARGYAEFTTIAKTGPIVGTKGGTPEKPVYYADDGRFGDKTLVAVNALYQKINAFNKSKGNTVEIKDPQKVPTKILQSPACTDQSSPIVQPGETAYVQQQLEKMKSASAGAKKIEESKVYADFSFLSTKNSKLHSVLMEQLKKDLKRG